MRDAMPGPARRAGRCAAAFLAAALALPPAMAPGAEPGRPASLLPEAGVRPAGSPLPPRPASPEPETAAPPAVQPATPAPPADSVAGRTAGRIIQPLFFQQAGPSGAGLTGRVFDPAGTAP